MKCTIIQHNTTQSTVNSTQCPVLSLIRQCPCVLQVITSHLGVLRIVLSRMTIYSLVIRSEYVIVLVMFLRQLSMYMIEYLLLLRYYYHQFKTVYKLCMPYEVAVR